MIGTTSPSAGNRRRTTPPTTSLMATSHLSMVIAAFSILLAIDLPLAQGQHRATCARTQPSPPAMVRSAHQRAIDRWRMLHACCMDSVGISDKARKCVVPTATCCMAFHAGSLCAKRYSYFNSISKIGAPGRNRTADLRFTKPLLYQLSYKGTALRLAYLLRQ